MGYKIDIAGAVEADLELIRQNIRKINGKATILETSGKSGRGIPELVDWISKIQKHDSDA